MKKSLHFFILILLGMLMQCEKKEAPATQLSVKIAGNCESCKQRIEGTLANKPGVKHAQWNSETKELIVVTDTTQTNLSQIQDFLAKAGHDSEGHIASAESYNSLPDCCKYRDRSH